MKARETCTYKSYPPFFSIFWEASEKYPISQKIDFKTHPLFRFFLGKFSWDKWPKDTHYPQENRNMYAAPLYIRVGGGGEAYMCIYVGEI